MSDVDVLKRGGRFSLFSRHSSPLQGPSPAAAGAVLLAVVAALSILPIVFIFIVQASSLYDILRLPAGFLPYLLRVTAQTLLLSVSVMVISLLVGIPAGYVLSRIPARQAYMFTVLLTVPLASPSLVSAIAIRNVFDRSEWFYKSILGLGIGLPSAYGFIGLLLALSLHSIPYAMLIARSGFLLVPREIEETAQSLGARPTKSAITVLLPCIMPQIVTACLMVLMYTMGDLGAPLIVGGGYKVFASEIYTNFISEWGDKKIPLAFALWTVFIFLVVLILLVQLGKVRMTRHAQNAHASFMSKEKIAVPRAAYAFMVFLTVIMLLPFINLIFNSIRSNRTYSVWQEEVPRFFSIAKTVLPSSFAIHDFRPVWTTMLLSLLAIPSMIAAGVLIAHTIKNMRKKELAMALMLAPAVLPGVLLGFGLLQSLYQLNLKTHATFWQVVILVLALILRGLPYVVIVLQSAVNASNIPLEDTARSLGASPAHAFVSVTLPQIRPVLGVAAVVGLFSCVTELAASLVIYPPGWQTMSMYIAYYMEEGILQRAVAMSIMLLAVVETTLTAAGLTLRNAERRLRTLSGTLSLFEPHQSAFLSAFTAVKPEEESAVSKPSSGKARMGRSFWIHRAGRLNSFGKSLGKSWGEFMQISFLRLRRADKTGADYSNAVERLKAENRGLRRKLALAEQKSLRMQINPHFFFNTLNTIVSLLRLDPNSAAETIGKLSSLFRYTLDASEEPMMFLHKEIEYIRTYLEIEKLRFGDTLAYSIDVPEDLYSMQIPPMLIQPLVENAIKYGKNEKGTAYVYLLAYRDRNDVYIEVTDYGSPQVDPGELWQREGTGIRNIRERLANLGAGSLIFVRNKPSGIIARLVLRIEE